MAATNDYSGHQTGLDSPARHHKTITPSDSVELTNVTRGIYVGTTGNVKVRSVFDEDETYVGVPAGFVIPIMAKLVFATGTTASNLLAMW